MMEKREKDIGTDKVYELPEITIVPFKDFYLAIAIKNAKWLVLYNENQCKILNCLIEKKDVLFALEHFDQDDVVEVLTQLEAKQFEDLAARSNFQNTRLHLHLTNKCNLQCPHCYMNSGKSLDKELSFEEIKELCTNFKKRGGTDISLTGGEPTTRNDFFEIIKFISSLGMKTSIYTNGALWTEEMVRTVSDFDIDGVQISIDGFDENSNSVIRGKNTFQQSLNTVDYFIKNGIYVKIAIAAPYEIIKEWPDQYIAFAKGLIGKYGKDAIEVNFSQSFMPGRNLSVEKIALIKNEYYDIVENVVASVYKDFEEDAFAANIYNHVFDSCGFGALNVMANGDFYFCDRVPNVNKVGNVRNIAFDDIFEQMQSAERAGKIDNFKPCNSCELRYICGGGCRVEYFEKFAENVDFSKIDFDSIAPRVCNPGVKEKIYNLMVKTNHKFFH